MCVSHSVVSNSLQPHGLHVVRQAPLPLKFSRQEYWSGLHSLPQGTFLTQGLNPGLLHCRQILYHWAAREVKSLLNVTTVYICGFLMTTECIPSTVWFTCTTFYIWSFECRVLGCRCVHMFWAIGMRPSTVHLTSVSIQSKQREWNKTCNIPQRSHQNWLHFVCQETIPSLRLIWDSLLW